MSHSLRSARNQVSLALVAVLLGLLVVVQLRAQAGGTGLETLSAQDLSDLVANLNTRNDQLRAEVATTEAQFDALTAAQARGDSSLGQLQNDLARVKAWAGLIPVSGQGIRIDVAGPITSIAADDLLNELRNAGAEALGVAGVRAVPGSVIAGDPGGLSVEDTALTDPFEVDAIGNGPALTGSLTRAGGIIAQVKATFPGVTITVTPVDLISLPATKRSLVPSDASPRL